MSLHDWTRVYPGTFHDFHASWIIHLKEALNGGWLPDDFYALAEQHASQVNPDVLTLTTRQPVQPEVPPPGGVLLAEAPPQVSTHMTADEDATYRMARRTLTIRHRTGHRIVAMIEILSPANKDRQGHLQQFLDKAIAALQYGIHLLVIDLFPPSPWDPQGIHAAIWDLVGGGTFELSAGKPLTLAAYRADRVPEAFVEPIGVGQRLSEMPLFLGTDWYIPILLEPTYMAAYTGVASYVKDILERRAPPEYP